MAYPNEIPTADNRDGQSRQTDCPTRGAENQDLILARLDFAQRAPGEHGAAGLTSNLLYDGSAADSGSRLPGNAGLAALANFIEYPGW